MRSRSVVLGLVAASALLSAACRRTFVVVPRPSGGYTRVDTLHARTDGRDVIVRFHHDTTWRVDTVVQLRVDTLYRGIRTVVRVDTLIRRDTIRIGRPPTRAESLATVRPRPVTDSDPARARVDTVLVTRVDTLRVGRVDTIRVTRVDTVRVVGRRTLFVPPGQFPPEGHCRVWIHDLPPGQQARSAPCASLTDIPAGAFILFGREAYDADFDWGTESRRSRVPPEIIALARRRNRP